jgi:hypothetical protein
LQEWLQYIYPIDIHVVGAKMMRFEIRRTYFAEHLVDTYPKLNNFNYREETIEKTCLDGSIRKARQATIIINSFTDLFELSKSIKEPLIIHGEEEYIEIYDDWRE